MSSGRCSVRIIAGQWRGRRLSFPSKSALRPTPERVRETLFNWLGQHILGAYCLDCYAGSGALSFEAISRGATKALLVDSDKQCIAALNNNVEMLAANERCQIHCSRFPKHLPKNFYDHRFDVIFIDPPFFKNLAERTCQWLEKENCLADEAWIYVEVEKSLEMTVPDTWHKHRETDCGEGKAILFKRDLSQPQSDDIN